MPVKRSGSPALDSTRDTTGPRRRRDPTTDGDEGEALFTPAQQHYLTSIRTELDSKIDNLRKGLDELTDQLATGPAGPHHDIDTFAKRYAYVDEKLLADAVAGLMLPELLGELIPRSSELYIPPPSTNPFLVAESDGSYRLVQPASTDNFTRY